MMYHPKEDYEISYEETTEIDFSKPKTAEEVGRKLLKLNQLDNVEIENHYHTRTFPAPDGSDVNTVSLRIGCGTWSIEQLMLTSLCLKDVESNSEYVRIS